VRRLVLRAGLAFTTWLNRREFRGQQFVRLNERPIEYGFVFRKVAELQPRTVLDVGTGSTALPHLLRTCGALVTASDNVRDYWPAGMINRHYHVVDDDITHTRLKPGFDLVTCISVLEHIEDFRGAVRNMLQLLAPGGHLILTCPFNERAYSPNVYERPLSELLGKPKPAYRTQAFSRRELDGFLAEGAALVDEERWRLTDGEYWTEGARLARPVRTRPDEPHQIACFLLART